MFTKKFVIYFIVLFLPMLIVSALLNIVYSMNVHKYIQISWLMVILLAVVLDALFTWTQTRKDREKKSE